MRRRRKGKDFEAARGQVGGSGSSLEVCKGYELGQEMVAVPPFRTPRPVFYLEPKYEREDRDAWLWYEPLEEYPHLFSSSPDWK